MGVEDGSSSLSMSSINLVRKLTIDPWNKVIDITPHYSVKKSALLGLKSKYRNTKEWSLSSIFSRTEEISFGF